MKTWNCAAAPEAAIPSIIGSMLRMTRSASSLRTHHRIAVLAVIGSSPVTRAATGVTAATGSAERMMKRPMVAFQKPITDQGSVTANSTTRMKSSDAEAAGRQREGQQPDQPHHRGEDDQR